MVSIRNVRLTKVNFKLKFEKKEAATIGTAKAAKQKNK